MEGERERRVRPEPAASTRRARSRRSGPAAGSITHFNFGFRDPAAAMADEAWDNFMEGLKAGGGRFPRVLARVNGKLTPLPIAHAGEVALRIQARSASKGIRLRPCWRCCIGLVHSRAHAPAIAAPQWVQNSGVAGGAPAGNRCIGRQGLRPAPAAHRLHRLPGPAVRAERGRRLRVPAGGAVVLARAGRGRRRGRRLVPRQGRERGSRAAPAAARRRPAGPAAGPPGASPAGPAGVASRFCKSSYAADQPGHRLAGRLHPAAGPRVWRRPPAPGPAARPGRRPPSGRPPAGRGRGDRGPSAAVRAIA